MVETSCAKAAQSMAGCIKEATNFITRKVQNVLQAARKEKIEV